MFNGFFVAAALLIFVAVFLAIEGALSWWNSTRGPEARRIARRIRMMSAGGNVDPEKTSLLKQRLLSNSPEIQRLLLQMPRVVTFDRFLVQSGTGWTVGAFLAITSGLFVACFALLLILRSPWELALVGSLVVAYFPTQYLVVRRMQRTKRFEELLPEGLDLIGRALRAGHSFPSALQMAGTELPDPLGEEFRQTFDEVNFGIAVPTALANLVGRVPSTDIGFFAIAVSIQRETGGNLSEVLDNISSIIRERLKLLGKVRALSAEGRLSAWVLSLLPFATALLLWTVDPNMMKLLWEEPAGRKLVAVGMVLMVTGIVAMRKIIHIHI